MIFVVFGTVPVPFDRLAKKIDEIAGEIAEPIVVQSGFTKYPYSKAKAHAFLTNEEMGQYMKEAALIISHGGMGTIAEALKIKKKTLVIPRNNREHNHSQVELAEELEKRGLVVYVRDIELLKDAINNISGFVPRAITYEPVQWEINAYLSSLNEINK